MAEYSVQNSEESFQDVHTWASCATAIMVRGDLGWMHPVEQDRLVLVVLELSMKRVRVLKRRCPSYHLSRLGDLQLFAILGISWDQLFPGPRNAGSGW